MLSFSFSASLLTEIPLRSIPITAGCNPEQQAQTPASGNAINTQKTDQEEGGFYGTNIPEAGMARSGKSYDEAIPVFCASRRR
jgi:hypothetical protein